MTRTARLLAAAVSIGVSFFAPAADAQPSPEAGGAFTPIAVPPDLVPARCVAGTSVPVAEASLSTVTTAPPPPLRNPAVTSNLEHPHAEAELLVFPRDKGAALVAQDPQWRDLFMTLGGKVIRADLEIPFYRLRFAKTVSLHNKVQALRAFPQVRAVRANGCVFPAQGGVFPNDPDYKNDQWALKDGFLRMSEAWTLEKGASGVVVAVIDSAFYHTNPDLLSHQWFNDCEDVNHNKQPDDVNHVNDPCPGEAANAPADDFRGWNFFDGNDLLFDNMNHGTMLAGIIGAEPNNLDLVAGINFDVRLMDLKIYNTGSTGYYDGILLAFKYAIDHGAKVINASWTYPGLFPELATKVDEAGLAGVVVVAAAGQGSTGADLDYYSVFPCNFNKANLICVTATTKSDVLVPGSNFGATAVHVGAPGEGIWSTMGTSLERAPELRSPHPR